MIGNEVGRSAEFIELAVEMLGQDARDALQFEFASFDGAFAKMTDHEDRADHDGGDDGGAATYHPPRRIGKGEQAPAMGVCRRRCAAALTQTHSSDPSEKTAFEQQCV